MTLCIHIAELRAAGSGRTALRLCILRPFEVLAYRIASRTKISLRHIAISRPEVRHERLMKIWAHGQDVQGQAIHVSRSMCSDIALYTFSRAPDPPHGEQPINQKTLGHLWPVPALLKQESKLIPRVGVHVVDYCSMLPVAKSQAATQPVLECQHTTRMGVLTATCARSDKMPQFIATMQHES